MNTKTAKENGSGEPSSQSVNRIERRSRFGRTLLLAGVFALLAMIYVPTPMHYTRFGYEGGGYRLIFDRSDTSVAFFQLVVNVAFGALLGAILANILPHTVKALRKVPSRVWRWAWRVVSVTVSVSVFFLFIAWCLYFLDAAQRRAQSDKEYASKCFADSEELERLSQAAPLLANRPGQRTRSDELTYAARASRWAALYFRHSVENYRLCGRANANDAREADRLAKASDERAAELDRRWKEATEQARSALAAEFPPIKKALPVATPTPATRFDPSTAASPRP